MASGQLSHELEEIIMAGRPLREIVSTLREYRRHGVARHEAQLALETSRGRAQDESVEDRILEVMDIVRGFRAPDDTVRDK